MSESLEGGFTAEIEYMVFDELRKEQVMLDALSHLDDMDISAEFDNAQKRKYDLELLAALMDGLLKDSLEQLRNELATGDPDTYEYLGLNCNNDDEDNDALTLPERNKLQFVKFFAEKPLDKSRLMILFLSSRLSEL